MNPTKLIGHLSVFLIFIFAGCASINSVSLTPIPAERKNPVRTERSKIVVLGMNFDNDFVDEMVNDLKRQCPNGKVAGILTKDEMIDYFIMLVYKRQVTATGYCSNSTMAVNQKNRRSASEDEEN